MSTVEEERILDPNFDVFQNKAIDITTEEMFVKELYPIEPLGNNDSNIRFSIPSEGNYWIKWSGIRLHSDIRLLRQKPGSSAWIKLDEADQVFPCNNFGHSIFRDVKVSLNLTTVSGGDANYHLTTYMKNTLQFGSLAKATHMHSQGYYTPLKTRNITLNTTGTTHKLDEHVHGWDDKENETNKGIIQRFAKSEWQSIQIPVSIDLFEQGKHLPNGFRVDLEFFRNDPNFYTVVKAEKDKGCQYRVEFQNIRLVVEYVKPTPEVLLAVERKRQKNSEILYQFNNLQCLRHTIPSSIDHWRFDNPFQNKQPKLVIIGFIPSDQFQKREERPFIFTSKNLRAVSLRTGGREIGGKVVDCTKLMECYTRFNEALHLVESTEDCGIDFDQYKDYNFFVAYDCTTNNSPDQLQSATNLTYSLEVKFINGSVRTQPTDMLLFFTTDEKLILEPDNHVLSGNMVQAEQKLVPPQIKRQRVL